MMVFSALLLWAVANKINVSTNGDIDWECAAAVAVIIPIASHLLSGTSWSHCLLLAAFLMPTNWLYFKISGHTNSILNFVLLLFPGIIICLLIPSLGASWIMEKL